MQVIIDFSPKEQKKRSNYISITDTEKLAIATSAIRGKTK